MTHNLNENNASQYIEEDEIDLRELWQTILKGKKLIVIVTFIITTLSVGYALKQPNVYSSEAMLIPTESASNGLGSLGGLAAMAGVSLGSASMTPDIAFQSMLDNYQFMKEFVVKNKILDHYNQEDFDKNYVFALGFSGIYDLFKSDKKKDDKEIDVDALTYNMIKQVQKSFSISSDKKTSLISISYSDMDRTYPPKIINAFLEDSSKYLVENNLKNLNNSLKYFQEELSHADEIELRQNLSMLISKLLEKKIMTKSKQYYQCDILTLPYEPYIKDKTKPKRALIVVVAFVTGLILSIFLVFFLEFIRGSKEEDETPRPTRVAY
jgi:uncharacterized protein involved in exopolysaccharide biosynthesis